MAKDGEGKKPAPPALIRAVNANDLDGAKSLLISGQAKIEDVDDSGMTALQHACYKGQLDMANMLLSYVSSYIPFFPTFLSRILCPKLGKKLNFCISLESFSFPLR